MKKQRVGRALLCAALVSAMIPASAFAETGSATKFADMPNNWSTAALQNAVDNGLITGYDVKGQKLIRPDGTLTRAEMGTIINKAFAAADAASISNAKDVPSGKWYYEQMAKAVQMGSFASSTELRPEDAITRQEVATVLAKVFKLPEAKSTALDSFSDKGSVAAWAKDFVGSMVENGYMTGNKGKLNPTSNITRAEFAAMMNNMVAQYINKADTYTTVATTGNVMVNTKDVTLKGTSIKGDLVLGDGIGDGDVTLDSVNISGNLVVRGGGVNSVIIKGDSKVPNVIVGKVAGNVRVAVEDKAAVTNVTVDDGQKSVIVEGTIDNLVIDNAVPVVAQKATIKTVEVNAANAGLTVDKNSTVTTVNVAKDAEKAAVTVAGTVTTVKTEAPNTEIKAESGSKITTVNTAASAEGSNVSIAKDANVSKLDNDAKITTSGEGKPSTTTGNGTTTEKTDSDKKTDSGSSSGGSSGGGGGSSTPTLGIDGVWYTDSSTTSAIEVPVKDGKYTIPVGVDASNAQIAVKFGNLKSGTYDATMSIKNGTSEAAYASTTGIDQKYLAALSGEKVTFNDITRMFDRIGNGSGWYIGADGKKHEGSDETAFKDAINAMFDRMGKGDVYTVTVTLKRAGGSTGSTTFEVTRER